MIQFRGLLAIPYKFASLQLRTNLLAMGHRRKGPTLEPVLENYMGPAITFTTQGSVRYKPHKYDAEMKEDSSVAAKFICTKPLSFLGKLRDRYITAMNEMAMGGDFTAMAGYHGTSGQECSYTMERCRSVKERQQETLLAALSRTRSQTHRESSQLHPP